MHIKEIYQRFNEIGSLVFSTIDDGYPETRIAHFFAYDDKGLYFRTMNTKPFYHQLVTSKKVSVCGLSASPEVRYDSEGLPLFNPGYSIRVTGDCTLVDLDYVKEKSKSDKHFLMGYNDVLKYPALEVFVLNKARGEIFDYDFELEHRDHKLLRTPFTINGMTYPKRGLSINDNCVNCKACYRACSFGAISKGIEHYEINSSKCDMCGDCTIACYFDAIDSIIK